jgi:hypothetical protein
MLEPTRFTLRLPAQLYDALRQIAEREERSLHQQIIYVLRRFVEAEEGQEPKLAA